MKNPRNWRVSPPTGWFGKCTAVNSLILIKRHILMAVDQYLLVKMGSGMGSRGSKNLRKTYIFTSWFLRLKNLISIFWIICMATLECKSQCPNLIWFMFMSSLAPRRILLVTVRQEKDAFLLSQDQPVPVGYTMKGFKVI